MLSRLSECIAQLAAIDGVSSRGVISFSVSATAEQRAAAEAFVAENWDCENQCPRPGASFAVAAARDAKIDAIDARSAELIGQGLVVNGGAPISLSAAAQINLLNIGVALSMGALQLPQDVSRLDGRAYTIRDAADAARIARLAGSRIKSVLDAGRALRSAVLDATTQDDIEAVVDERA